MKQMNVVTTIMVLLLLVLLPFASYAQVPGQINFQGQLTDNLGDRVADDYYEMNFSLYHVSSGGTPFWDEVQTILVENGIYNVILGQAPNQLDPDDIDGDIYLGIKIGTDAEMTPRQKITSTAFALKSANADFATDANTLDGLDSIVFDQSAHVALTNNPHDVTAVQIGAITTETDPTVLASIKDGVSWSELSGIPSGFADGVDNTGITTETDPQVGNNTSGYVPVWYGSELVSGSIYDVWLPTEGRRVGLGTENLLGKLTVATDNSTAIYANTESTEESDAAVNGLNSGNGSGVVGKHGSSGNYGRLGSSMYGAIGTNNNGNYGILGWGFGVYGYNASTQNYGSLGGTEGAMGYHSSSSNYGQLGRSDYGVYGLHNTSGNWGALGTSDVGVEGYTSSTNEWHNAIFGKNEGQGSGLYGWSQNRFGIVGVTLSTDPNEAGVWAVNNGVGPGIIATAGSEGYAGKFNGKVSVKVLEISGADLSEQYKVRSTLSSMLPTPGKVVSIDPENPGDLVVSNAAYDRKVAGIISGAGDISIGMLMGKEGKETDGKNPIALTGRVYCMADTSNGAISPGDLLTTSNTPGHAMKVSDYERAQGAILGKAMSSLEAGQDLVLVLVTLQ